MVKETFRQFIIKGTVSVISSDIPFMFPYSRNALLTFAEKPQIKIISFTTNKH